MRPLRLTLAIAAVLPALAASRAQAEDSREVRVRFDLSRCVKEDVCATERVTGDGVVVRSASAGSVMYAEVETSFGPNVTVEILYGDGEPTFHYWEAQNEQLSFFGMISNGALDAPDVEELWTRGGNFSFRADDKGEFRLIENGIIEPFRRDPVPPTTGGGGGGNGGGGNGGGAGVIIIDDGGGCGGSEPPPDDPYASDSGCEGDTTTDDPYDDGSSSGCEGDTGTDDGSSSGGCEGDTTDSGSASSGGCEGDSGDTVSSGSSSCEGDGYESYSKAKSRRAANSMWRLAWPIVLVGAINRGLRFRGAMRR